MLVLAEAEIPAAISMAFRAGQLRARRSTLDRTQLLEDDPRPLTRMVRSAFGPAVSPEPHGIEAWEAEGGAGG